MLRPDAAESQPEFAIRFHEQMKGEIPRTSERNAAMLAQWDKYGDNRERQIGDDLFSDHYRRVDNVAIFAEHATADRKLEDGRVIPGRRYDRDKLKSMVDKANHHIRDVEAFCPITDGHTSDDPKAAQPAILGMSGSARLGMIGDEEPRWAIFTDEYHRNDCKDRLKDARHRSVEVMLTPQVEDSYFWPVAALATDAPRLRMPPGRYSKGSGDSYHYVDRYEIGLDSDQYMMAAPGGNNTTMPQYGCDNANYGNSAAMTDDGLLPDDNQKAEQIMQAFMTSQLGQVVMQILEQNGMDGKPTPAVSQPPEMAPLDADEADPGIVDQGSQTPPAGPGAAAGGGFPSSQPPGAAPMDPQKTQAGQQFSDPAERDRYSALEARVEALATENQQLREQVAGLLAHNTGQDRYSRLSDLARTHVLDVQVELARCEKYSAEQFDGHITAITEHYQRRVDTVPDYAAIAGAGQVGQAPQHETESQGMYSELGDGDVGEIVKYAQAHRLGYDDARDRYQKELKKDRAGQPAA